MSSAYTGRSTPTTVFAWAIWYFAFTIQTHWACAWRNIILKTIFRTKFQLFELRQFFVQVFNFYSKVCRYGPINSYHSFWCSDLILYLHNKDMLDIRMKKFYCEKIILTKWQLCELRQFLCMFSTGRFVSDLFRNHIVGFPTKWLIYSLHHKQLKIRFFDWLLLCGGYLISLAYCQFLFPSKCVLSFKMCFVHAGPYRNDISECLIKPEKLTELINFKSPEKIPKD